MQLLTSVELTELAASTIAAHIRSASETRPRVAIALSGGSTPWAVFSQLADLDLPWGRVDVYQVDERVVPPNHPDRNLTHLNRVLLQRVPATAYPMPVDDVDLETAAGRYAEQLPARFDLVQLGLGEDGHTASLVPGDPVLDISNRDVAVTASYRGHRRMTLTFPVLNRARAIIWIVNGESKQIALQRLLKGDREMPAGRVETSRAVVLADLAATAL